MTPTDNPETLKRRERREQREIYGLTRATKWFIAGIVVLLVLLISGAITYLTIALNDARNMGRSQEIAISEWSRRYVSLYDQYTTQTNTKPTSLSPSAIDYLISTETSGNGSASSIPGLPVSDGASTVTPPGFKFHIATNGHVTNLTCAPTSDYDPAAPTYDCK